jgi:hypothetical protein
LLIPHPPTRRTVTHEIRQQCREHSDMIIFVDNKPIWNKVQTVETDTRNPLFLALMSSHC